MVQQQVLDTVDAKNVRVYAIWEPILRNDNHDSALQAPKLIPDARATHYWIDGHAVGELFQSAIRLKSEPAWDVYLVYAAGVVWGDDVPVPDYFQHQLGGRLPKELRLDGEALAQRIQAMLDEATAR